MEEAELRRLISGGETGRLEFKESFGDGVIESRKVAAFTIKEVPIKPVSMRGRCLARRGSANHLMTLQEIADMYLKTYNMSWDSLADPGKTTADLASDKVERFRIRSSPEITRPAPGTR